jgi:hypothetical protein
MAAIAEDCGKQRSGDSQCPSSLLNETFRVLERLPALN